MSQIRSQGMKPELLVRSMVHRLGYRFRLHRHGMPGKPDLVLPRYRTVNLCQRLFLALASRPKLPDCGFTQDQSQVLGTKAHTNADS